MLIILKKLEFYKEGLFEKHLLDLREILSFAELDRPYLENWLTKLQLNEAWLKAQE